MNARLIDGTSRLYVGFRHQKTPAVSCQCMASSKALGDRKIFRYVMMPLLALVVCGFCVAIANGNIKLRCCNEQLRVQKAYLQTRVGLLERQWHRDASREIITARASEELGLQTLAAPATIIVYNRKTGNPLEVDGR